MTYSLSLLLGSKQVPRWFAEAIKFAQESDLISVDQVIIAETTSTEATKKDWRYYFQNLSQLGCWEIIQLGGKLTEKIFGTIPELEKELIDDTLNIHEENIYKTNIIEKRENRYSFPSGALSRVSESDCALHLGIGILTGEILTAPKMGVWGFHHGDIRKYRGGPPGLWEYLNGDRYAGVTLQRYTESLDGGTILAERRVDITDLDIWRQVRRRLCQNSRELLTEALRKLESGESFSKTPDTLGDIYSRSDLVCKKSIHYLNKTIPGYIRYVVYSPNTPYQ